MLVPYSHTQPAFAQCPNVCPSLITAAVGDNILLECAACCRCWVGREEVCWDPCFVVSDICPTLLDTAVILIRNQNIRTLIYRPRRPPYGAVLRKNDVLYNINNK